MNEMYRTNVRNTEINREFIFKSGNTKYKINK